MSFSLPNIIEERILVSPIAVYAGKQKVDGVTSQRYNAVFADTVQTKQELRDTPNEFLGVFHGRVGALDFRRVTR